MREQSAAARIRWSKTMRTKTRTYCDGLSGAEIVTMPQACAEECSSQGACDAAVARWIDRVTWHADDNGLRRSLRECGAWDDLATADTETLRERALWVAACDLRENDREDARGGLPAGCWVDRDGS